MTPPSTTPGPVAIVTGVGPGTGAAMARRFSSGGYRVAMVARNAERLAELEATTPGTRAFPVDVTDTDQLNRTVDRILAELGAPRVVIHNAVGGAFGSFLDIPPETLQTNFNVNVMAFLHLARRIAPLMVDAGEGFILATGNTSALRGKADFAGFAPTKAAQRILAESMARDLGPRGVHVAYLVIDAVIYLAWTRKRFHEAPESFFIKPESIADEAYRLAHQPRDAWSFNVEVRPFAERW
jgi:NAD(P)-dependent dehydrogenase (short-subunit alcohol dehydrogenase family)